MIDPATHLGSIRLTVGDLDTIRGFYERAIGLQTIETTNGLTRLGGPEGHVVLELDHQPDAPARPPGSTGLFHHAILVPSRRDLARALHRVDGAGWRLQGASDHNVSEALYLADPEGNGIELYRDRPRDEWRWHGDRIEMGTFRLDVDALYGAVASSGDGMPAGTTLGHVHLQVTDLHEAEAFWCDTVGFEPTLREAPGALFIAAGGYHHHVGLNTWAGVGAPAPPPGARGLQSFEVVVPDQAEVDRVLTRVGSADWPQATQLVVRAAAG